MRLFFLILISATVSCTQNDSKKVDLDKQKNDSVTKSQVEVNEKPLKPTLQITPQSDSSVEGNLFFTQDGKTVFYFDSYYKKGAIIINGTKYKLNKYSTVLKTGSYKLSGKEVNIIVPKSKFKKTGENECLLGTNSDVSVILGTDTLILNNIKVEDCTDVEDRD